jgi:hypothetical protein
MCDCINTVTEKILAKQAEQKPERTILPLEEFDGEGLGNRAFTFGSGDGYKMFVPFVYRYTFKKTNGETSKTRKETVNMFFTYCPFCGTKYDS